MMEKSYTLQKSQDKIASLKEKMKGPREELAQAKAALEAEHKCSRDLEEIINKAFEDMQQTKEETKAAIEGMQQAQEEAKKATAEIA